MLAAGLLLLAAGYRLLFLGYWLQVAERFTSMTIADPLLFTVGKIVRNCFYEII